MVFRTISERLGLNSNPNFIFLGSPEAEAEALPNSKMPLQMVYKDHHNLTDALSNEKFIVCGKKGSGKSAFAEYISLIAEDDPNLFCKFIKQGETNLEQIVQIGKEAGHPIERENLYTWLILTNILKLFSDNQAAQDNKEYSLLKQFLDKNSGFIDIRDSEIKEILTKNGFEIQIEYLKRFFSSKLKKDIEIKQTKASFFKLIPHLKEVVLTVLKGESEKDNKNNYVLFFDDLDITFNAKNPESIESIISLLRVSKEINNDFFAKNFIDSKVVILLRDDIANSVSFSSSDSAKLFASYSISINWYQDEYHKSSPETDLNIRKFLNERLRYALKGKAVTLNQGDPWRTFVEEPFNGNSNSEPISKTSFKYVLDHTFFRPRDLILFFSPLAKHEYKLPLSKAQINQLIGSYCNEVANELRNELSCFYSPSEILNIFNALGAISNACKSNQNHNVTFKEARDIFTENCSQIDSKRVIYDLFERSILGNMSPNGFIYFKHREPSSDIYKFDEDKNIVLHSAVKIYCTNKGFT